MRDPARILIADDNADNLAIFEARLKSQSYDIVLARDGEEALALAREVLPDVILLDIMMPKIDGIEVCRRLKGDPSLPFMPIVLVTAKTAQKDVVAGLDAGADDYLTKPVDHGALLARVRSILRVKELHDQVQAQAAELSDWNRTLEARVAQQVSEIERVSRLKRFLSPQVAELIVTSGHDRMLESHRSDVTVVFCDLRGFTAFAEAAAPDQVMGVLKDYHDSLGPLIHRFEGTLERFLGDGLMVLFNDPIPCADPAARAVSLGVRMREAFDSLAHKWRADGHQLGFGVGIAQGVATLGRIGFEGRFDYAAIGSAPNLGARLCAEAQAGQILVSDAVRSAALDHATFEPVGELSLKGFQRPIAAYNVIALKT